MTNRTDRAIMSVRVDQKGSSYIIQPDPNRMELDVVHSRLSPTRSNRTSYFFNVTGLPAARLPQLDPKSATSTMNISAILQPEGKSIENNTAAIPITNPEADLEDEDKKEERNGDSVSNSVKSAPFEEMSSTFNSQSDTSMVRSSASTVASIRKTTTPGTTTETAAIRLHPAPSNSALREDTLEVTVPNKSKPSFDLTRFLMEVAGHVTSDLFFPSGSSGTARPIRPVQANPDRNIPSLLDGSMFGNLFPLEKKLTESSGSVESSSRPTGDSYRKSPTVSDEEGGRQTRISGAASVSESPPEMDIITAPNLWNLIVSSSLSAQSDPSAGSAAGNEHENHHGYVIDGSEVPQVITPPIVRETMHQSGPIPSRLGTITHQAPNERLLPAQPSVRPTTRPSERPSARPSARPSTRSPTKPPTVQPLTRPTVAMEETQDDYYYDYVYYDDETESEAEVTSSKPATEAVSSPEAKLKPLKIPPEILGQFYSAVPRLGISSSKSKPTGAVSTSHVINDRPPFPYGVHLGDLSDAEEPELEPYFNKKLNVTAADPVPVIETDNQLNLEENRPPLIYRAADAIDVNDQEFNVVQVNGTLADENESAGIYISSASLTYIIIGTLGGFSLLFFCVVGLTMRFRSKRRFHFRTFNSFNTLIHRLDQESHSISATVPGTPNQITNSVLVSSEFTDSIEPQKRKKAVDAMEESAEPAEPAEPPEVADSVGRHKLGSWFSGRNSLSSLHGTAQRKLRSEMALPTVATTLSRVSEAKKITRAYYTDGKTASTRDLVATCDSMSSNLELVPSSPALADRDSWLHASYHDRGNSIAELSQSPFFITSHSVANDEQPRSNSQTVRSQAHLTSSVNDYDLDLALEALDLSLENDIGDGTPNPPTLPPKKRPTAALPDSHWSHIDDRLI